MRGAFSAISGTSTSMLDKSRSTRQESVSLTGSGKETKEQADQNDARDALHSDHAQDNGRTASSGERDHDGHSEGVRRETRRQPTDETAKVQDNQLEGRPVSDIGERF